MRARHLLKLRPHWWQTYEHDDFWTVERSDRPQSWQMTGNVKSVNYKIVGKLVCDDARDYDGTGDGNDGYARLPMSVMLLPFSPSLICCCG